jgi:heme exporter protein B
MQNFLIILRQEILISSRSFGKIFTNFLFFVISVFVFFLISQNQQNQGFTAFYNISIIWFSLLSCAIFSANDFLKKDFEDGTIEQIIGSIDNFEIFILAKILANWLVNILPILLIIFPLGALFELSYQLIIKLLVVIFFASLAINFICTFCGSLAVLENAAALIAVIAFPLVVPILLIGEGCFAGEDYGVLKILIGLTIFIGVISVFAAAKIVRIAAE